MGRTPGRLLVTWETTTVDTEITAALDLPESERVTRLDGVLLADGVRIGLESTYLPAHRFGDLVDDFDPTTSLYAAIRARGVVFGSAIERIETVLPSQREADLLESTTAMPMLLLNRCSLEIHGVPIEYVRAVYRGDRVAFEARLADR